MKWDGTGAFGHWLHVVDNAQAVPILAGASNHLLPVQLGTAWNGTMGLVGHYLSWLRDAVPGGVAGCCTGYGIMGRTGQCNPLAHCFISCATFCVPNRYKKCCDHHQKIGKRPMSSIWHHLKHHFPPWQYFFIVISCKRPHLLRYWCPLSRLGGRDALPLHLGCQLHQGEVETPGYFLASVIAAAPLMRAANSWFQSPKTQH